jgi:hypothetical protein
VADETYTKSVADYTGFGIDGKHEFSICAFDCGLAQ